ncbi:rhomboid family intramembrane serine protease [Candidatus Binatia bacterium]|nr:rhomboid family intramembrane serine protease [Candidatus Binatia bacterium]
MTDEPEPSALAPDEIASGLERRRADDVVVLLAAMGIPAESRRRLGDDGWTVVSAIDDAARARALVAEEYPDGPGAPSDPAPAAAGRAAVRLPVRALWLGRADWAVALVAVACIAWFVRMQASGPLTRARLLEHGAITWDQVWVGEWWRLASALFVHFDGVHLLANLITLALVGPPLANLLGPWRFLVIFVLTGVAGNLASHVLAPSASLKAGASGGISGVLGALGGTGLDPGWGGRFARWQVVGALFAIYALLVGAGDDSDHVAHLGGLLTGIVLGAALTPPVVPSRRGPGRYGTDSTTSTTQPSAE